MQYLFLIVIYFEKSLDRDIELNGHIFVQLGQRLVYLARSNESE